MHTKRTYDSTQEFSTLIYNPGKKNKKSMILVKNLPEDLISEICCFLNTFDLGKNSTVSKKWSNAISDPISSG